MEGGIPICHAQKSGKRGAISEGVEAGKKGSEETINTPQRYGEYFFSYFKRRGQCKGGLAKGVIKLRREPIDPVKKQSGGGESFGTP